MSWSTKRTLPLAILAAVALALIGAPLLRKARRSPATPSVATPPHGGAPAAAPGEDQNVDDPPSADDGTLAHVEGTVRDALTSAPLGRVDVIFALADGAESTAASGADGRFAVALAAGRYRVRAVGDDVIGLSPTPLELRGGVRVDGFDVRAARLASVAGRVVDDTGTPLAGAAVTFVATLPGIRVGSRDLDPQGSAVTDAAGAFQLQVAPGAVLLAAALDGAQGQQALPQVAPGAHLAGIELVVARGATLGGLVRDPAGTPVASAVVAASSGQRARTGADGRFSLAHVPAGPVLLEAQAAGFASSAPLPIDVARGSTRDDLVLELRAGVALTGRVLGPDGAPVGGARVSAWRPETRLGVPAVLSAADGAFRLEGLTDGRYELSAVKTGFAAARAVATAPADDIELRLRATGSLAGVVRDSTGAPVTQFNIRTEGHGAGARFVAADGAYRIDGIEPGDYELVVAAPGFAPARRPITIPSGGVGDGAVTLTAGAVVSGTVRAADGTPLAGARVAALTGHEGEATHTDAAGRFELADLAPGRRSLVITQPGYVTRNEGGLVLVAGARRTVDVALSPLDAGGGGGAVEFAGIGAVLGMAQQQVVISQVVAGAPAERAGLARGDVVVAVDGAATAGRTLADIIEDIRGVAGTAVRLELRRGDATFTLDVVRGTVRFGG